jgi:hypothetical protein
MKDQKKVSLSKKASASEEAPGKRPKWLKAVEKEINNLVSSPIVKNNKFKSKQTTNTSYDLGKST